MRALMAAVALGTIVSCYSWITPSSIQECERICSHNGGLNKIEGGACRDMGTRACYCKNGVRAELPFD